MKFSDKLIDLRKKAGLSQEELGEKLNVTRQTISKWELGQTTPELDKLKEISKLFNISVDELIGSETVSEKKEDVKINTSKSNKGKGREKIVLGILVVVLILCIGCLSYMGITSYRRHKENESHEANNLFDRFFENFDEVDEDIKVNIDNGNLDSNYKGTITGLHASDGIDSIIALNNKGKNIVVDFCGTEYKKEEINDIRKLINKYSSYNFQYEYKDKRIVKVIITREYSDSEKHDQNGLFENLYNGRISGFFVKNVINNIYKKNQKAEKKITLNFLGTLYTDNNQINNVQSNVDNSIEYNVHYEYDNDGFIIKAIIEKVN